jgi:hypothetical protein
VIGPLLKQEIESTFEIIRSRSSQNELVFICPEPGCGDQKGNRSVNLKNGKTNCWRCNIGGSFIPWAKRLGYHFSNAGDATSQLTLKQLFDIKPEIRSILPVVAEVKLPEGFEYCRDNMGSVYTRLIGEMAVRKNLLLDDLLEANVGFTRYHPGWEPFAIFPVTEYDTTVYYQGRTYVDEPDVKTKKFPSNNEVKYGARYWIYNIDEAIKKRAKIVIVVESILNVLSLRWYIREHNLGEHIAVVAAFKHAVSFEQFYKIAKMRHVEEVCLMFDHDAIEHSWKDARKFTNHFKITIAEMPEGPEGPDGKNKRLDPNDDVAVAWQVFLTRQAYTPMSSNYARLRIEHQKQFEKTSGLIGDRFV